MGVRQWHLLESYDGLNIYADKLEANVKVGADLVSRKEIMKIVEQ